MHRREPERIHTQRLDVVELGDQARQVAVAIAVRVAEAADINLIDRGAPPPGKSAQLLVPNAVRAGLARAARGLTIETAEDFGSNKMCIESVCGQEALCLAAAMDSLRACRTIFLS